MPTTKSQQHNRSHPAPRRTPLKKNEALRKRAMEASPISLALGRELMYLQLRFIETLQRRRLPGAAAVSLLGSGKVVFIFLCLWFWIFLPHLGWVPARAASLVLSTVGIVKSVFKGPRPYWYSDVDDSLRIVALDPTLELSFAFPSGHTSAAVAVYGTLALHEIIPYSALVVMVVLIGVSRVFTAAHFAHDVVAGALLGAFMLIFTPLLDEYFGDVYLHHALAMFGVAGLTWSVVVGQFPRGEKIPFHLVQEGVSGIGFCAGLAVCYLLEHAVHGEDPSRSVQRRASRLPPWAIALGFAVVVVIDRLNKRIYHHSGAETFSRPKLLLISSLYGTILVWSLWILPSMVNYYSSYFLEPRAGES